MKSFVATVKYNNTLQCYQARVNDDLIGRELRRSDDLAAVMMDVCPSFSNKQFSHDVWMWIVSRHATPSAFIKWCHKNKRLTIGRRNEEKSGIYEKITDSDFIVRAGIIMLNDIKEFRRNLDRAYAAGMTNY